MNDAEVERQTARVRPLIDWWGEELGIRACWKVDYKFIRECAKDDPDCIAETMVRWQYAHAVFSVYLPVVEEQDDEELENAIVHEYMHLLLNEMRALRDRSDPVTSALWDEERCREEHAATTLARAFIWVRDKARNERVDRRPDGSPGESEAV
jgi:hypothetical protein